VPDLFNQAQGVETRTIPVFELQNDTCNRRERSGVPGVDARSMTEPNVKLKIDQYVQRLGVKYELIGDNIWLLDFHDRGLPHVVLYAEDDLVTVRAKVMQLPASQRELFFEELLRLNVELAHGAYALEGEIVIWVDTLEFAGMDYKEFLASLDAAALSVAEHYPRLSKYRNGGAHGTI
jgi:hypothetical protein